ncbi:MAG: hypothetical protein PHE88_08870 [Elusimicrobia bacterium]|nr:hypothetical protein [Elusimicrobiota bacterium]
MDLERFLLLLSDFMDDEMDFDLIEDFEENLEDEFCCHFLNTFRKTAELCHQIEMQQVPRILHYRIIQTIENIENTKKPVKMRKKPTKRLHRKIVSHHSLY